MRVPLLASLGAVTVLFHLVGHATAGDAPGALALGDKDLMINLGMDVQERAQAATSAGANGASYDVFRGASGKSNDVDFNMRRARLLLSGSYTDEWRFGLILNADNVDRTGENGTGNTNTVANGGAQDATRNVQLFKAYLEHFWVVADGVDAVAHGGLDFPFFNRSIADDPWWLFPQQRVSGNLMGNRAVGGRFMLQGTRFDLGFDVDESMDPQEQITPAQPHHEGLFYSSRLEYTVFSDSGKKARYRESYRGASGHSLMLTADIGYDDNDYGLAATRTDAICYGFEAVGHWDGLSCLVEGRALHTHEQAYAGGGLNNSVLSEAFCAQAGYAFPALGIILEPALRIQRLVLDRGVDQQSNYNSGGVIAGGGANTALNAANLGLPAWLATFGPQDKYNSGNDMDVGVNWIFSRYTLLQTAYTRWNGQAGTNGGHPDANIVRAQLQLFF
jgi:hypothetical protein